MMKPEQEEKVQELMNLMRAMKINATEEIDVTSSSEWDLLGEAIQRLNWCSWKIKSSWIPGTKANVTVKVKPEVETTYQDKIIQLRKELENKVPISNKHLETDRNILQVILDICGVLEEPIDQLHLLSLYVEKGQLLSLMYTAPEAMGIRWLQLARYLDVHHRDKPKVIAIYNNQPIDTSSESSSKSLSDDDVELSKVTI